MLAEEVAAFLGVGGEVIELGGRFDLAGGPSAGVRGLDELEGAAADGEDPVDRVHDEVLAAGEMGGAQHGGEAAAVFGGGCGDGGVGEFGASGEEVVEADERVGGGPGGHVGGPAGQEGHSVSAFKGVGLHAAPGPVGLVVPSFDVGLGPMRAVVTREEDGRVLGQGAVIEDLQDAAHEVVHLGDEVAVGAGAAASPVFGEGHPGVMGGGEWEVEEEWAGRGLALEERLGFGCERGKDLVGMEIGGGGAGSPEAFAALSLALAPLDTPGRWGDNAVVSEVEVGIHVEGGGDAEEEVEAQVEGAAAEGLGEIDEAGVGGGLGVVSELGGGAGRPGESEVPLADGGGGVAVGAEDGSEGGPVGFDQGWGVAPEDAALEASAPGVAAGQEGITGRRTDG